jgi:hypothetical protein
MKHTSKRDTRNIVPLQKNSGFMELIWIDGLDQAAGGGRMKRLSSEMALLPCISYGTVKASTEWNTSSR